MKFSSLAVAMLAWRAVDAAQSNNNAAQDEPPTAVTSIATSGDEQGDALVRVCILVVMRHCRILL